MYVLRISGVRQANTKKKVFFSRWLCIFVLPVTSCH